MDRKICSKCKQEKSVGEFSKNKRSKDGLFPRCKKCQKQYYAENREKITEKSKQYYQKNSEKIKKREKQYRVKNSEKIKKRKKKYRSKNKEKIKDGELKYKYGITLEQYNRMTQQQGNVCLICKQEKKLFVDHCHDTGAVRGLLCGECNSAIGLLKETPQYFINALEYLEAYNSRNEQKMLG